MIYEHHEDWGCPHVIKVHVAFADIAKGTDALQFTNRLKQLMQWELPHLNGFGMDVLDFNLANYYAAKHIERRYGEHLSQFDPCGLRVRIVEPLNKDDFRWVNICFKLKADAMLFKLTFGGE